MRKSKSIISMTLCLLLIVSVFAGCGSTKTPAAESTVVETSTASTAEASTAVNAEKLELSVAIWEIQDGFNAAGAANDKIFNDLCTKLNITIKPIQITWNDWNDKLQIWASSNQMPDITAGLLNPALYNTLAKQGVLKAIPEDLSKYPNLDKELSLPTLQPKKIDGKYYMIPRMNGSLDEHQAALSRPMIYRKDWAAQAGYTEQPKTFDEYVSMAKAVMKQHPDAVGLSINTKWYLGTAFLWSFPQAAVDSSWVEENGKWVPVYTSEKMYDGIKQLKQLYTEGILDKDFVIQKDADGVVKFQNGKSFSAFVGSTIDAIKFAETNSTTVADAIGGMIPFAAADGISYCFNGNPFWSETYLSNAIDDKKLDRALQLMDYMSSDEYTLLKSNGIENVDWKIDNGKAVSLMTGDQTMKTKYPISDKFSWLASWNSLTARSDNKVFSANVPTAQYDKFFNADYYKALQEKTTPIPINFDVMQMSTPAKDKIDTLRTEAMDGMVKVIIGKGDPITMWKDIIKGFDAKGLPEAIAETNAKVAELGIK